MPKIKIFAFSNHFIFAFSKGHTGCSVDKKLKDKSKRVPIKRLIMK